MAGRVKTRSSDLYGAASLYQEALGSLSVFGTHPDTRLGNDPIDRTGAVLSSGCSASSAEKAATRCSACASEAVVSRAFAMSSFSALVSLYRPPQVCSHSKSGSAKVNEKLKTRFLPSPAWREEDHPASPGDAHAVGQSDVIANAQPDVPWLADLALGDVARAPPQRHPRKS